MSSILDEIEIVILHHLIENDSEAIIAKATNLSKARVHKLINEIGSFESLSKIKGIIEDRFGKVSENIEIYMYEELFESMKSKKGIEKVNQNDRFIEIIFTEAKTKSIKADDLFIKAYQISRNFKLGYKNKRLILTLNINNLDKHWIYYLIDILNSI